jgi:hypothetical protein
MQSATFVVRKVVTCVVDDQIDNRAFRKRCRFIENEASLLDPCLERTHARTVRVYNLPGNPITIAPGS